MSVLESYYTENPYGKSDECAKFTIDSSNQFILSGITNSGEKYTLSFWIKSDADSTLTIYGETIQTTVEWIRFVSTFTATSEDLTFVFDSTGTYYIYHAQLEIGTVATDWTAAPEDTEYVIFEAKSDLALAEQNLQNVEARVGATEGELKSAQQEVANAQSAVDAAMEDLLITKQTVADLKVQSDNINIEVTKIIDYGVDKVTTSMGYTFNDEGLHIQKPGQEIVNTLDDEGMSVTRDGEVMLQADKDGVIATDVRVRNFLIVGTHARFEDYNDGTDSKRTACFWIDG